MFAFVDACSLQVSFLFEAWESETEMIAARGVECGIVATGCSLPMKQERVLNTYRHMRWEVKNRSGVSSAHPSNSCVVLRTNVMFLSLGRASCVRHMVVCGGERW